MYSVLYVDDEPGLLDLGKTFLETMGQFHVDIITSASDALPLTRTKHYDAIISDYQMPVMDGIDFLRQVRSSGNDIPFILFTGRGREEIVIKALNEGADFYLQKGGDPTAQFAELAHKIRIAVQRRQAALALEESEHRYRDVVETQTEFISRFLPDGTHVFANEAYCRYFGKTRQQIVGRRFIPPIPKEDLERIRRHFKELTPEHPSAEVEHRVILPDGKIRWQWWSDHAIFDKNGRAVEYQSVGKDITDRKNAEEALKVSENLYRTIFDTTENATIIIEKDTTIVLANARFARLSGYSLPEIEGKKSWTEFIVPEDLEMMKKFHYARREGSANIPLAYEFRFINRSGATRYCIINVAMIPGTTRSVASLLDLTERKNAETELQKSENLYRTIFDTTGAASIIIGPDTTILLANEGWVNLTGIPREEQENKISWTAFFRKEDLERMKGYHYARRKDPAGVPKAYESRLIDAKGVSHTIIVNVGMIPGTKNSVASLVDITERRQAEDELRGAYEQLTAAQEQLRAQFDELTENGQKIRESERQFRHLVELAPIPIAQIHLDGTIQYVNPQFTKTTGWMLEDIPTMDHWGNLAYPDQEYMLSIRNEWRKRITLAREKKEKIEPLVCRIHRKDGQERVIEFSGVVFEDTLLAIGYDMTDRMNAVKALKEREEEYHRILNNLQDAYIRVNEKGIVSRVSPSAVRMYRYGSEEEMIGLPAESLYTGGRKEREETLRKLQEAGGITDFHGNAPRKDGTSVAVSLNIQFVRDVTGRITGTEAIVRDISERMKMEDSLRSSEEKYRNILESIQECYYRTDEKGTIILASPSGAVLLGYDSTEDLYGRDLATTLYFNPEDRKIFLAEIEKTGSVKNYEVLIRKKDGTPLTVLTSSHKYYDTYGKFLGIEGIYRDITDRKQAEVALRTSENLYRALFDFTLAATCIIGPDTTILKVNPSWENLCGYTREEAEGSLSWTSFIHPEDLKRLREYHVARRKDTGDAPNVYDCRVVDRKGEVHYCIAYVDVIPETQNSIASLLDITERKKAEIELQKSENLYRTIFDFTGAASIIIGPDTTILRANEEWEKLTGIPREQQETKLSWTVFFTKEDLDRMKKYHYARRKDPAGIPNIYEARMTVREGDVRNVIVNVGMIPGTMNSVASLVDITERRRAEDGLRRQLEELTRTQETLRASEEKFRMFAEYIPGLTTITDEQGRYTYVSPSILRLLGHRAGDLLGKNPLDEDFPLGISRGDVRRIAAAIKKARKSPGTPIPIAPFRGRSHDGKTFWIEGTVIYLPDIEWIRGMLFHGQDVTDRMPAEGGLKEAGKRAGP